MTLRIKRLCENDRTRICLSGALRSAYLASLRSEIELSGQPAALDLDEVSVIDIDGIRFLNECQAQGIQVVNCTPYIRQWMVQEKRTDRDEEERLRSGDG
jgi:hypothetical protein